MTVNIVMLVKDRERLTRQSIGSLYRNSPQDSFNLTVVDDESNWDVRRCLGPNSTCISIFASMKITGMARNLGVYWAEKYWGRGDWLYLSDNDVYFTPGWLEKLVNACPPIMIDLLLLGGWNHPYLLPKEGTGDRVVPWIKFNNGLSIQQHDAVTGASQLMRWETWDKYGPLDAHTPGVSQSEDWSFCQRIITAGGRCGSIYPRVVFNTGITNSFGAPATGQDLMVKELEEAKKKYPDLYWE